MRENRPLQKSLEYLNLVPEVICSVTHRSLTAQRPGQGPTSTRRLAEPAESMRAEPAERVAWQPEGQDTRAHSAGHCWTKHCLRGSATPLLPILPKARTEVFGKHLPWYRTAKRTMQGSKEAESFSLLRRAVNDRGRTKTLSSFSSSL